MFHSICSETGQLQGLCQKHFPQHKSVLFWQSDFGALSCFILLPPYSSWKLLSDGKLRHLLWVSCQHIRLVSFWFLRSPKQYVSIYYVAAHNFTLGNLIELELEFKSDARHGILLSFHTNRPLNYPAFSIFLDNGKVALRKRAVQLN